MAERRAATKGRRMGSSRRKQLREGYGEAPAPGPSEEPPWASEIVQKVQDFFQERDKDQTGFVTRSDMQKLKEEGFPCSVEELELVFDGLDVTGTGRLSTEDFTAGLRQFLSSQKASRDHRRRKTASRRVRLVLPSPMLEEVDSEERRHFAAFMDQLGTDNVSEEKEIWQLWVKLRQDEPQLLGNLEDFLAKMRHRIQEARSKKEALEVTLNRHVAEHDKEVQQLCEALEQQIQQEQQQLQQESMARSHQHSLELQQALDASEREVQRLVTAQMELERRCRSLRSTQQAASTENRQLEESNRELEDRLQHLHQQLQQTQGRLQKARASVVWERAEEPGDRAVTELPGEVPLSPQTSPEKSEKYRSEMQIRLGSQSDEPKAKGTHQVVWEMPPAEINLLVAPRRASSAEEDPFPEFLKEERFSDQSSLLREMNDAIVALSKQLKGAPGAPPTLADAAHHPQDDAEPQTEVEAATAHGTTPGDLRETIPGHMGHQLVEGDLKEGPATAELRASDVTQAGASVGAGAQEPGAEQGKSLEEARRMLFLQGKGAGVKELVLKVAEHPQGAPGESPEAGEQALMEVEGEGWMQEKAREPGEAEEVASGWGQSLGTGLGQPEAGLAAGWQLVKDQLGLAVAPAEHAQPLGTGLGEEAHPPLRLSKNLEINPGECLEPEPPSPGEARMGAAHGDGVLPVVTAAPAPGMLEEEHVGVEVQPQGPTGDGEELPAQAQRGGSSRARAEEGDVEVPQPQGECVRGEAARGGSVGPEVPVAGLPTDLQEGSAGPDVAPLEAQSSDVNMQWLPEVESGLQPPSQASSLDIEQGGSVAPDVEPLDQVDKPELVERVEAEDSQADMELSECPSFESLEGEVDHAATQLVEEAEDGAQRQGEHGLAQEHLLDPQGAGVRQGEGAGADVQPREEAGILDTLETQSTDANVQLIPEVAESKLTPGGGTVTDLQPLSEADDLWTEQGGSVAPDVEPLDQVDKTELVERVEAEDSQADMELSEGPSLETLQGREDHAAVQLGEETAILDMLETHSTDANVQLIAEVEELKLIPGRGTETDLQLSSEVSSLGMEQEGSVAPDVEPLDQVDKPELVERVEAEDSQADMELFEDPSLESLEGEVDHVATQLMEEVEDGAQGQDEHGLAQERLLDPQGAGVGQGEGAGADVQPREDTLETQSTDANVQLNAEVEELKLIPERGTETDLQLSSEVSSLGMEQGGSVAPDVEPLDQVNKPELVTMEAEDSQTDMELSGGPSFETLEGEVDHAAVQLKEEAEAGAQEQDEQGLAQEPLLDPHGVTIRQGEGAGADMQPPEEALILDTLEDQSTDANVQLIAEVDELKLTPGGGTDADLQPPNEISSQDTEQGGSVAPDVQPLDQVDKLELVEMEAEDSLQADLELCEGLSTEAPWGGQGRAATQLTEEAEDGAEEQDEHELPHKPVAPRGAGVGQGEGAGADMQPLEEAGILDTLETQSTGANVQLIAEVEELKSASGGGREANLEPLGDTRMWEGEWSQTPGSVAGLCAAHTPDAWEGAAGACVSPPAEATSCPEGDAADAKDPSLEAKLGALTGPNGQIPGDTQPLELSQGARAVAEGKPLDGAQDLEVMQGERLGAGARTLVETQDLGLKQGHDDGVSTLASPVSKVPVQTTTLKLETVMQKDVLIPDVRRLGTSGQAAQSELQEQVLAQADKVRLHTASQQLEEKPPRVMETEQAAAGPAEPPKQEVPPVSTPHQQVPQEGAGNDQLGTVLGDRSLGDAANSSLQLQRKLLREQNEDLSVGQREKQQEVGQKTSQKGEPSPGEPGVVTADGAGAAPRGSAEASLDPDHLYNVLFIGDSHVGKTSFLYRLHANAFNPHLTTTVGLDYQVKNLMVDNKHFALRLWDSAGQERYRSLTKQFFRKADGVVLMYDITSEYSFSDTRYWLSCIQEGAEDGVVILLLGNKTDCAAERQVPTEEGERLAKEHQLTFYECSAASGHNVTESMVSLVRLLKVHEDELKSKTKEVPKPPQKKKGCCW